MRWLGLQIGDKPMPEQISVMPYVITRPLQARQKGRDSADDIFICDFVNENVSVLIKISLKFVLKGPIDTIPSLVRIMAWRQTGDKPLSEPMMSYAADTHICVTRP